MTYEKAAREYIAECRQLLAAAREQSYPGKRDTRWVEINLADVFQLDAWLEAALEQIQKGKV